jgi:hypothetical protein
MPYVPPSAATPSGDGPDIQLGPGSEVPASPLRRPEEEEQQRRKKVAADRRSQAAQIDAEMANWSANGRVVPDAVRAQQEAVRNRLHKEADELESGARPMTPRNQPPPAGTPVRSAGSTVTVNGPAQEAVAGVRDANTSPRDVLRYARQIVQQNMHSQRGELTDDEMAELDAITKMPSGKAMPLLREWNAQRGLVRARNSAAAQRDKQININMARMRPAERIAMLQRSGMGASAEDRAWIAGSMGDQPMMENFGKQATAQDALRAQEMGRQADREATSGDVATQGQLANEGIKIGVDAKIAQDRAANPTPKDRAQDAARILREVDPALQQQMLAELFGRGLPEGTPPGEAERMAMDAMASHYARINPNHPAVQQKLREVHKAGYEQFRAWVLTHMGLRSDDEVNNLYYDMKSKIGQWLDPYNWGYSRR